MDCKIYGGCRDSGRRFMLAVYSTADMASAYLPSFVLLQILPSNMKSTSPQQKTDYPQELAVTFRGPLSYTGAQPQADPPDLS